MRRAALVSVGVHAALIAGFAAWHESRPAGAIEDPRTQALELATVDVALVPIAEIIPLDVALFAGETSGGTASPVATSEAAPRSDPGNTRIATTAAAGAGGSGIASERDPTTKPDGGGAARSMAMRGGRPDLSIPESAVAKILERPGSVYVPTIDPRLAPTGGGKHVIRDRVTAMHVNPDGTVRFKDKADFKIRFVVPFSREAIDEMVQQAKRDFVAWYADPYAAQKPVPTDEQPRACMMHQDVCYTGPDSSEGGGIIGGKAEITDALHRKLIGDPYASRKLALLDSTRDARVHIGAQHRAEKLDRSAELAARNAELAMRLPDPAARRAALFALWDECIEGEGPAGAAGERARAIVIGVVRARMPAGSAHAFTDDEIAKLNASRSSRLRFTPY